MAAIAAADNDEPPPGEDAPVGAKLDWLVQKTIDMGKDCATTPAHVLRLFAEMLRVREEMLRVREEHRYIIRQQNKIFKELRGMRDVRERAEAAGAAGGDNV